jgi:hypothetical protein
VTKAPASESGRYNGRYNDRTQQQDARTMGEDGEKRERF